MTAGRRRNRDRGFQSLSRTEWEDFGRKGCVSVGHKCPEGNLRVLLLSDDECEGDLDGNFLLESTQTPKEVSDEATTMGLCTTLEL